MVSDVAEDHIFVSLDKALGGLHVNLLDNLAHVL